MPSLALHEFHEALAAFQDQAREHALQRAKQEEQHKMKEAQRRPSEGARQPQTKQEQLKKASQEQASKHAVETTQDSSKPGFADCFLLLSTAARPSETMLVCR